MNLGPRYLLVGPALEVEARALLVSITPPTNGRAPIELVVGAHVGRDFYVFADPQR